MPTGVEMFKAVKRATADHEINAEFAFNPLDAIALLSLKPADLEAMGYDHARAEEVSYALFKADYGPLGNSLGIRFVMTHEAPRLLPD